MNIRNPLIFFTLVVAFAAALALATSRTGAEATHAGESESSAVHEAAAAARGLAAGAAVAQQSRSVSLTVISSTTHTPAGGPSRLISTSTLRRLSDGSFSRKTSHYEEDGSVRETEHLVGGVGRGVFRVDDSRRLLLLTAPMPAGLAPLTEEELRRSPRFTREDSVLGHRTIVLRYPAATDEASYVERHFAPELQSILKEVTASASGLRVMEVTEVTPGEPDRSTFAPLFAYRVDASNHEEKLRRVERTEGGSATAQELRGHLTHAVKGRQ